MTEDVQNSVMTCARGRDELKQPVLTPPLALGQRMSSSIPADVAELIPSTCCEVCCGSIRRTHRHQIIDTVMHAVYACHGEPVLDAARPGQSDA